MAANTWGVNPTTWGEGNWGKQSDCTVILTGQAITTGTYTIQTGWGRQAWGVNDWGLALNQVTVIPTGQ